MSFSAFSALTVPHATASAIAFTARSMPSSGIRWTSAPPTFQLPVASGGTAYGEGAIEPLVLERTGAFHMPRATGGGEALAEG